MQIKYENKFKIILLNYLVVPNIIPIFVLSMINHRDVLT